MISDTELVRMLGKHIGIYPLVERNIEGASIFLRASKFAWSKKEQKTIVSGDTISIPAHDTAIILTEEAIYLNKYIAGICISRVSHTVKNLIMTTTPIKPGWTGKLIIALYNTGERTEHIKVGDGIAVIMFSRLDSAACSCDSRVSARADILHYAGLELNDEQGAALQTELNKREATDYKYLLKAMEESEDFRKFKQRTKRKHIDLLSCIIALFFLAFIAMSFWLVKTGGTWRINNVITTLLPVVLSSCITLAIAKWKN